MPSILNVCRVPSVLKTCRRSHRVVPGFIVSILSKTCVSQAAWSCVHGSELADWIGRTKAEPPITMIENSKSTKNRRIIVCLLTRSTQQNSGGWFHLPKDCGRWSLKCHYLVSSTQYSRRNLVTNCRWSFMAKRRACNPGEGSAGRKLST